MPDPAATSASAVILLCRDLLLASQVRLAAQRAGIALQTVRDAAAAAGAVGDRLIVDCNLAGALEAVPAFRLRPNAIIIGFVAHTDAATVAAARAAGVGQVLARSSFFADPARFLA